MQSDVKVLIENVTYSHLITMTFIINTDIIHLECSGSFCIFFFFYPFLVLLKKEI